MLNNVKDLTRSFLRMSGLCIFECLKILNISTLKAAKNAQKINKFIDFYGPADSYGNKIQKNEDLIIFFILLSFK